jgi:hypothetical protein
MRDVAGMKGHAGRAPLHDSEVGQHLARAAELAQAAIRAVDDGAALDQMDLGSGPKSPRRQDQVVRHVRTSFALLEVGGRDYREGAVRLLDDGLRRADAVHRAAGPGPAGSDHRGIAARGRGLGRAAAG